MEPGQSRNGTAINFEEARADFEAAWCTILPMLIEENFQEWRQQRDWTAWKYAMCDASIKLPTQVSSGRSRCFCGAPIDIRGVYQHIREAHSGKVAA